MATTNIKHNKQIKCVFLKEPNSKAHKTPMIKGNKILKNGMDLKFITYKCNKKENYIFNPTNKISSVCS